MSSRMPERRGMRLEAEFAYREVCETWRTENYGYGGGSDVSVPLRLSLGVLCAERDLDASGFALPFSWPLAVLYRLRRAMGGVLGADQPPFPAHEALEARVKKAAEWFVLLVLVVVVAGMALYANSLIVDATYRGTAGVSWNFGTSGTAGRSTPLLLGGAG